MIVKSKVKSKSGIKSKIKTKIKPKVKVEAKPKAKPIKKIIAKPAKKIAPKPKIVEKIQPAVMEKPKSHPPVRHAKPAPAYKPMPAPVRRVVNPLADRRSIKRTARVLQFNYMKAPGIEYEFEVGDTVEVFCDHEKNRERIRGWAKGIVVQVDNKMVAVQFRLNVFLTDGWMVPDRILWYPLNSEHIRPAAGTKKPALKKDFIPEY